MLMAEWEKRRLPYPISDDSIEVQLKKARRREHYLRVRRKIIILMFLILGTFFWFFARYLQALDM